MTLPSSDIIASPRRVLLEIAIASPEDAEAAELGGADRLELNSALLLGGLTPSLGTWIEARSRSNLPMVAMLRPRSGGFCYSDAEFSAMRRDLDLFLAHGAAGIAFGVLDERGEIDEARNRTLIEQIGQKGDAVFHRAFDVTPDASRSLETLIELGVRRVMTSGQEDSAYNGSVRIAELLLQSAGRIEILPAGGINRFTLADVLWKTGCDQVHASLKTVRRDGSTGARPSIGFGGALRPPEDRYEVTDPAAVAELRARLGRA